jgi:photosystem II stability/assembly factor-like uncharacterized protein
MGIRVDNVRALALAPNGDIYVSIERFDSFLAELVYKSTDNGTTWIYASNGLSGVEFNSMVAGSNGDIFVGSDGYGVFRSTNAGHDWASVLGTPNTAGAHISALASNGAGYIFAASYLGIARSTNNGDTWVQLNTGLLEPYVRSLAIAPNGHIFGAAWSAGILRSTDNGTMWKSVYSGVNDHTVFVTPDGTVFFAEEWNTGGAIRRSTDDGSTWTVVSGLPATSQFQVRAFAAVPGGGTLMSYSEDGVRLTPDNGTTWLRRNSGLRALTVKALHLHRSGVVLAGTFGAGIFRSFNGRDWQQSNDGAPGIYVTSIASNSKGTVFATSWDAGIFKSTDAGLTWTSVRNDLSGSALVVDAEDAIVAGTYGRIYRSTDDGNTWAGSDTGLVSWWVNCIGASPNGHIFVGTDYGFFRTKDNGVTWDTLGQNWGIPSLAINSLGTIYIPNGQGGGILRSTDDGDSWSVIGSGLGGPGNPIYCAAATDLFANAPAGVYHSTNGGDTWTPVGTGLPSNFVNTLSRDSSGHLLAGTWGNAVYRTEASITAVNENREFMPKTFSLIQNYPNPFNASTVISYEVRSPAHVSLKVFNLLGEEIATLADGWKNSGMYRVTWDGSNSPTGVYLFRLESRGFTETRKSTLIR